MSRSARSLVSRARAGFSLIEILAVLVIISILLIVLLPRLRGVQELAEERLTRLFISELDGAIGEYENHFGDYPPSNFLESWGMPPNSTNLGSEALVLSLWSNEWGGVGLSEDKLVNLDNDQSKRPLARFQKPALFELRDEWHNPIAYFHRRDYGQTHTYVVEDPESGAERESRVSARTNPLTSSFFNPQKYQLISAGADGEFGTDDDIANFKIEKK